MLPRTAYVLLWFPKPSETFIFHEVVRLREMGLPLKVFSLYGEWPRNLAPHMAMASRETVRLGIPSIRHLHKDIAYWREREPRLSRHLFATIPVRKWSDLESAGENLWAFLCGFRLARMFEADRIEHIHAPWANGPATAAWVASRLTGIPFSFAAHAGDIFPPDGALTEKMRDCSFVRTENKANVSHLLQHGQGSENKIFVVYNGIPVRPTGRFPRPVESPFRILALGRFVPKKGFDILIHACKLLDNSGLDFRLTVGGSGRLDKSLRQLTRTLGLEHKVNFPGFVLHSGVPDFLCSGDVFVMPSVIDSSGDRDGVPTVILEALLHRVPVVASAVSGIGEIIEDGVTGLLVPPGNPSALAQAITVMATERTAALAMAGRGRSAVIEGFDVERNCRTILGLLQTHTPARPADRIVRLSGSSPL